MIKLSKLNSIINKLADKPFEYGTCDCFIFTNALVKAWHNKDYLPLHNSYHNEESARAYLKAFGGIEALTTGTLGYSVDPSLCVDGDVATAEIAPGEVALGFVFDGNVLFKTEKTVVKLPLAKCRRGWRIR